MKSINRFLLSILCAICHTGHTAGRCTCLLDCLCMYVCLCLCVCVTYVKLHFNCWANICLNRDKWNLAWKRFLCPDVSPNGNGNENWYGTDFYLNWTLIKVNSEHKKAVHQTKLWYQSKATTFAIAQLNGLACYTPIACRKGMHNSIDIIFPLVLSVSFSPPSLWLVLLALTCCNTCTYTNNLWDSCPQLLLCHVCECVPKLSLSFCKKEKFGGRFTCNINHKIDAQLSRGKSRRYKWS